MPFQNPGTFLKRTHSRQAMSALSLVQLVHSAESQIISCQSNLETPPHRKHLECFQVRSAAMSEGLMVSLGSSAEALMGISMPRGLVESTSKSEIPRRDLIGEFGSGPLGGGNFEGDWGRSTEPPSSGGLRSWSPKSNSAWVGCTRSQRLEGGGSGGGEAHLLPWERRKMPKAPACSLCAPEVSLLQSRTQALCVQV